MLTFEVDLIWLRGIERVRDNPLNHGAMLPHFSTKTLH
jgi:hypothetical protein